MAEPFPQNLIEFTQRFATKEACAEYLTGGRWLEGFVCPGCGGGRDMGDFGNLPLAGAASWNGMDVTSP